MSQFESIWPDGARIVVVLTFLVESWSEGKAPPYSPMTSPPKPGALDLAGIQWSEYGPRAPSTRTPHPERAEGAVEGEARRSGQGGHPRPKLDSGSSSRLREGPAGMTE